jgi:hypothetical protein
VRRRGAFVGLVRRRFLWSTGQVRASGFLATVEQVRSGTATLSAAVLALLAITSCSSSDAGPRSLPSLTSRSVVAATAQPAPSAARAITALGADAFVRFFFLELNRAFRTSSPEIIRAHSQTDCLTCENYAQALEASREAGHYMQGDSFVIKDVAAAPLQARGTIVEVFGTSPARRQVDVHGQLVEALKAEGAFHLQVAVKTTPSGWKISGIRLAA